MNKIQLVLSTKILFVKRSFWKVFAIKTYLNLFKVFLKGSSQELFGNNFQQLRFEIVLIKIPTNDVIRIYKELILNYF